MLINTGQVDINASETIQISNPFSRRFTPLCAAAEGGHPNIVMMLLDHGAGSATGEMEEWQHRRVLAWAAKNGHEAIAKLLRERIKSDTESEEE